MSKSIYDEVIEILLNMGTEFISVPCNPIGEENSDMIHLRDVTETCEANMHGVVKALKQAQKQEKLLELYKELSNYVDEQTYAHELSEITRLKIIIKELESE